MSPAQFTIPPAALDKNKSEDAAWSPINYFPLDHNYMSSHPTTIASFATPSITPQNLSPYTHVYSDSVSPSLNTSADSWSALGEQITSNFDDQTDPLLTFDFNKEPCLPAFLQNSLDYPEDHGGTNYQSSEYLTESSGLTLPPSPSSDQFSIRVSSDNAHKAAISEGFRESQYCAPDHECSQSTPGPSSNANKALSHEDDTKSSTAPDSSPRVTVHLLEKEQPQHQGRPLGTAESVSTEKPFTMSADDSFASDVYHGTYAGGDDRGVWAHESSDRLGGWDPHHRPVDEGVSVNEMDALRRTTERNDNVNDWVTMLGDGQLPPNHPPPPSFAISEAQSDGIDPREISLGDQTENVPLPDQIYYTEANGPLVEEDFALMRAPRTWADAPAIYPITKKNAERQQPETSQAAIARFDQMCQDTGSVLSRAATWGTRRRSLPSIAEIDGITSGNFLKKLSITRDRKPSILLKELCGRIAKPNAPPKRNLTCPEGELASEIHVPSQVQHRATLQLGSRSPSWTKRSPSSLNTALLSMGTSAASIATQHARTGSISTVASPKSPFLGVRIPLRRPRSKSELSKNTTVTDEESNSYTHSNLAELWKKSGGPPVAQLRTRHTTTDFDDEDDEDDDVHDDGELRAESNNIIDEVTPKVAGFKEQILKMNPSLAEHNTFLVDRIAYQQVARYKMLLGHRLRHLQQIAARSCPSRHMCIALGGSAIHYNTSREPHGASSATMTLEDDQGDATQVEGAITAESFPVDIPMPPATSMPAEFECQLCYSTKKFAKPSDWTKHVHEDVQPFTCTWDRCREPKIFKRKADWVRHENEGHRHLEWWTCDVEDCRHTCYRRDNFLQHLVREHKFLEPKVKTKAALKRAGAQDPTWQKVEKCHKETTARPQDEPCRFCGKVLLTWKKLTVHLAKHMEALSLPLLRMVANRDLETDTIISPIQDPPPRTFPPLIPEVQQPLSTSPSPGQSSALGNSSSVKLDYSNSQQPYSYDTSSNFAPYYSAQVHELQQSSNVNFAGPSTFQPTSAYQDLPVTASSYMPSQPYMTVPPHVEPFPAYIGALHLQTENPLYDMTSMDARSAPTIGVEHQQYQSQGSASPYIQSPPQGQGGFFHQQR